MAAQRLAGGPSPVAWSSMRSVNSSVWVAGLPAVVPGRVHQQRAAGRRSRWRAAGALDAHGGDDLLGVRAARRRRPARRPAARCPRTAAQAGEPVGGVGEHLERVHRDHHQPEAGGPGANSRQVARAPGGRARRTSGGLAARGGGRSSASIAGERSSAQTSWPSRASGIATRPVAQPRSSTGRAAAGGRGARQNADVVDVVGVLEREAARLVLSSLTPERLRDARAAPGSRAGPSIAV